MTFLNLKIILIIFSCNIFSIKRYTVNCFSCNTSTIHNTRINLLFFNYITRDFYFPSHSSGSPIGLGLLLISFHVISLRGYLLPDIQSSISTIIQPSNNCWLCLYIASNITSCLQFTISSEPCNNAPLILSLI